MQLSQTDVKPGVVVTRTITSADKHPDVVTSVTLMLESRIDDSWRWIYFMGVAPPNGTPINIVPSSDTAISAVGVGPQAVEFQIPEVPPGNYRMRQDLNYGFSDGTPVEVTL